MRINKKGFTMAEVLITLSIIGVIAAILFPSILANYNERTLKAKRQALFARMSQAMGQMGNTFRNYPSVKNAAGKTNCLNTPGECVDNGSALKFISEGLSKYYKIAAVCDADTMSACDVPSNITLENGSDFVLKNAKDWKSYNRQITINGADGFYYDVETAAFRTKNGESILLWYNPNCTSLSMGSDSTLYVTNLLCVNMVYDLNGSKNKPNKVGEDIGFMSVFYNDSPVVVSPRPYDWKAVPDYQSTTDASNNIQITGWNKVNFAQAKAACAAIGDDLRLPSFEEAMSMLFNRELWAPQAEQKSEIGYSTLWTNTFIGAYTVRTVRFNPDEGASDNYMVGSTAGTGNITSYVTRCVYDN